MYLSYLNQMPFFWNGNQLQWIVFVMDGILWLQTWVAQYVVVCVCRAWKELTLYDRGNIDICNIIFSASAHKVWFRCLQWRSSEWIVWRMIPQHHKHWQTLQKESKFPHLAAREIVTKGGEGGAAGGGLWRTSWISSIFTASAKKVGMISKSLYYIILNL